MQGEMALAALPMRSGVLPQRSPCFTLPQQTFVLLDGVRRSEAFLRHLGALAEPGSQELEEAIGAWRRAHTEEFVAERAQKQLPAGSHDPGQDDICGHRLGEPWEIRNIAAVCDARDEIGALDHELSLIHI